MKTKEKIACLLRLGEHIKDKLEKDAFKDILQKAKIQNPWFTEENSKSALMAIANNYLNEQVLVNVSDRYSINNLHTPRRVGLVMAGNIPAVGFHDLLCIFLSGHQALVKYSSKDEVIMSYLLETLFTIDSRAKNYFTQVERLKKYDAVIATGGNNASRYFEYYFQSVPHIIRKNRNAVGVLDGSESSHEIMKLGQDIFSFFGLGCRNVSKIYIPQQFDLVQLLDTLHAYKDLILHNKYKNNFDYNVALFLLNKVKFLNNGSLILKEDQQIASRIACLHYEFYNDFKKLTKELQIKSTEIQCVVSKEPVDGFTYIEFGEAQSPDFFNYADGVDTMQFLISLP